VLCFCLRALQRGQIAPAAAAEGSLSISLTYYAKNARGKFAVVKSMSDAINGADGKCKYGVCTALKRATKGAAEVAGVAAETANTFKNGESKQMVTRFKFPGCPIDCQQPMQVGLAPGGSSTCCFCVNACNAQVAAFSCTAEGTRLCVADSCCYAACGCDNVDLLIAAVYVLCLPCLQCVCL
jgi:hypothetical protein